MSGTKPIQLAYDLFEPISGVKDETPIIFSHGITASKEYWHDIPQIVADATNRKVYAVDARNHGDSEWCDDLDFDANATDLLHFIDEIKAEKVILVGHSLGGMTSMKVALQNPERVEKLVVEDMKVSKISQQVIDLILLFVSLAKIALQNLPPTGTLEECSSCIRDFIYSSLPENLKQFINRHSNDHRIILKKNSDGSFSYKANLNHIEQELRHFHSVSKGYTGTYEGPVCFIYGMKSPFEVKQDEEQIKNFFPRVEYIGIEDAFHGVHTDCPRPFTEELLKFLKK